MQSSSARLLLALDKFRGSLSATQACSQLAAGIRDIEPGVAIDRVLVADGGEGTLEAFAVAGFRMIPVGGISGDGNDFASGQYASDGTTAVVELAALGGLATTVPTRESALRRTSRAVGEAVLAAMDSGHTSIVLALGGSASTDGGAGMMYALGLRMLDGAGTSLVPGLHDLRDVAEVRLAGLDPRLSTVNFTIAADVDSPLLGARGAANVFGPQKGADPTAIEHLEERLSSYSQAVVAAVAVDHRATPGAGAAGGVGFSALAFLDATFRPGIDLVLEMQQFNERVAAAQIVITGEGRLDAQSMSGKAPVGVSRLAAKSDVPVIAVVGQCRLTRKELRACGFDQVYSLEDLEPDASRSFRNAASLMRDLGRTIALDLLSTSIAADPATSRTDS